MTYKTNYWEQTMQPFVVSYNLISTYKAPLP